MSLKSIHLKRASKKSYKAVTLKSNALIYLTLSAVYGDPPMKVNSYLWSVRTIVLTLYHSNYTKDTLVVKNHAHSSEWIHS